MLDPDKTAATSTSLERAISARTATIGTICLGNVGLPLAVAVARAGYPTLGFDIDPAKVDLLGGTSYIDTVKGEHLANILPQKPFRPAANFEEFRSCDVIVIVSDIRESPSFKFIELPEKRGVTVAFHDPHIREIPQTREHPEFSGRRSVALSPEALVSHDAILVATDHAAVDYGLIARHARLVVDTRNVFSRKGLSADHILNASTLVHR